MAGDCGICRRRVALFSHHLNCSFCDRTYHIKCLPFITKTDSIYANRLENSWLCIKCAEEELPFNNIDENNSFYDALSEFWFDSTQIPIEDLQTKAFVPFEINSDSSHHPLFDVDPDIQYFNKIHRGDINSDYYTVESFSSKCSQMVDRNMFSLFHVNIRSIPKNLRVSG